MYYEMHKNTEINNNTFVVLDNFIQNIPFSVKIVPLNDSEIIERPGGLKINNFTNGSVFIHNRAFSPPGCLHFKVNNDKVKNEFMCYIVCEQLNINVECVIILFNNLKEIDIEDLVKNDIIKFDDKPSQE